MGQASDVADVKTVIYHQSVVFSRSQQFKYPIFLLTI